jgi:hypothetical protein
MRGKRVLVRARVHLQNVVGGELKLRPSLRQRGWRGWRGRLAAGRRAQRREKREAGDDRGDPHVS